MMWHTRPEKLLAGTGYTSWLAGQVSHYPYTASPASKISSGSVAGSPRTEIDCSSPQRSPEEGGRRCADPRPEQLLLRKGRLIRVWEKGSSD